MTNPAKQLRLSDLFVVTGVLAGYTAQWNINSWNVGDLVLCFTLLVVWNRPLVFRFWACGMATYGAGLLVFGLNQPFPTQRVLPSSWGAAILVEAIAAMYVFPALLESVAEVSENADGPSTLSDSAAELTAPKKSYSIWSLLVIMTLLAVLASPFPSAVCRAFYHPVTLEYFVTHQLIVWTAIATTVWILTRRRLLVACLLFTLMAITWCPIALEAYVDSTAIYPILNRCGVGWLYLDFYTYLRFKFEYETILCD
jgi:hypothetical protein